MEDQGRPLTGIVWMLATGLCFVAVTGLVRSLGQDLPAAEAAFLRFLAGSLLMAPAMLRALTQGLPRATWRLIGARGALHVVAVVLWFHAMARIPVAEVTAIGYLNPIVVTLGAALFLGERLQLRRSLAILVALAGALVILRPGFREVTEGHLAQIGAAVSFGLSYLLAKQLSAQVGAGVMVALLSLVVTLGLLPFALAVWVPPTAGQVARLCVVAVFATLGHYAMGRAFAAAPLTVTQPVTFLQLVWAALLGWFAFGEAVDPLVLAGGAMIVGAITYMTWREAQIRRRAVTPAAEATKL
ncbi:MAG: DMT family transporter [Albidovulum sp.]